MKDSYAILIATRNRPKQLNFLLKSISQLEIPPTLIVVVSSGNSIATTIENYCDLKIVHKHITEYGQIRQKMVGIKLIPLDINWVLFLDDDLLLEKSSTRKLLEFACNSDNPKLFGMGLAESNRKIINPRRKAESDKTGCVSKSGRNISYMTSKYPIQTQWLNGASMWKREAVDLYHFEFLDSRYSICEDLIFSFSMSHRGVLFFVPDAIFSFQPEVTQHFNDIEIFRARAYWKLYFVSMFDNLSSYRFLSRQILATIKFILRRKDSSVTISKRFTVGYRVLFDLTTTVIKKRSTLELLKKTT